MKYAYLIMAHNEFYVLEKLIKLLDDNDSDIYIHIDKKVKNFDFEKFKKTNCADEVFLQTICYNSPYYNNLYLKKDDDYKQIMRFIDWNRGKPYTFKIEDLTELTNSEMLFARKFSSKVDKEIIDKIYKKVTK